uniref:Uncharacterized protein n=1 Tax=Salix viminalis TaxID=40686 RepID=A0A6N2MJ36_SALVM
MIYKDKNTGKLPWICRWPLFLFYEEDGVLVTFCCSSRLSLYTNLLTSIRETRWNFRSRACLSYRTGIKR